jgi:hypothetical protein
MIINNFQVQHILKAYSQQLSTRTRVPKADGGKKAVPRDEITLSQESRKRMVADRIADQIITQLAESSERNDTGKEILNRLSQEYGRPLEISANGREGIILKVVCETDGESSGSLSPSENEELRKKLFNITQSFVYAQMI